MVKENSQVFSTILYHFVNVGEDKYPAQTTINGQDEATYQEAIKSFLSTFVENSDSLAVTIEPRDVSSAYAKSGGNSSPPRAAQNNNPPPAGLETPDCPIHNVPITVKYRKRDNMPFAACGEKNADGSWCNWTPNKR